MTSAIDYRQQISGELRLVPDEKLKSLAKIVHVFSEESAESKLPRACDKARNNESEPFDIL